MTTSSAGPAAPAPLGASAPSPADAGRGASGVEGAVAAAMASQVERLANAFFAAGFPGAGLQLPAPGLPANPEAFSSETAAAGAPIASAPSAPAFTPPPAVGPNALNVGKGGAAPSVALPPTPGILQYHPIANAPPPKESDLRAAPGMLSEATGGPTPINFARSDTSAPGTPYFLQLAGLPMAPARPTPPGFAPPGGGFSPGSATSFPAPSSTSPIPTSSSPSAYEPPGAAEGTPAAPGSPAGSAGFPYDFRTGLHDGGFPLPSGAPPFASSLPSTPGFSGPPTVPGAPPVNAAVPGGYGVPTSLPTSSSPTGFHAPAGTSEATPTDVSAVSTPNAPGGRDAGAPARASSYDFRPEIVADTDTTPSRIFDPYAVKRDFPILQERVRGRQIVWLDNAATTQKPNAVIERLSYFYEHENSNIHRAAHTLAARATDAYEGARDKVRRFVNAPSKNEIVFARGTTEAINLIAQSWGRRNVREGDEIVITWLEHHANIVPWQLLCQEKGARLKVAPVDSGGQVLLDEYEKLLGPRTRLVSFTQVSNALGTITPAKEMVAMAKRHGAVVHVDGAQAVSHMPVDVQSLGCDFFSFSGHKVFGPTGIGALFGRREILEAMPPWQGGGNMIADVTFEKTKYNPPPFRFEAGTGNIGDAVGLGAALDYVTSLGLPNIARYEHELLEYGTELLRHVPGLTIIGTAPDKAGVLSFVLDGQKTEEVGGLLDQEGIAVRSGHHCAQPILRRFGVEATVRASLAPYNTREDLDALAAALHRLQSGRSRRS